MLKAQESGNKVGIIQAVHTSMVTEDMVHHSLPDMGHGMPDAQRLRYLLLLKRLAKRLIFQVDPERYHVIQ